MSQINDLSLEHLQCEMARVDLRIQRQVKLWQLAGQDTQNQFRGLYISDQDARGLLDRPIGMHWGQLTKLSAENERAYTQSLAYLDTKRQEIEARASQRGERLRLHHLREAFGLRPLEEDILLIALAPALDLRYEHIYGYLQDDVTRKLPSLSLVLDLFDLSSSNRLALLGVLSQNGPLFRHRLIERHTASTTVSPLGQALSVDPSVVSWLLGCYQPHATLGRRTRLFAIEELSDTSAVFLTTNKIETILPSLAQQPVLVFYGSDYESQENAALCCAAHLARPLLSIDLSEGTTPGESAAEKITLALRDASLLGAITCLMHWEICLDADKNARIETLQAICDHPDLVILCSESPWQVTGLNRQRAFFWLEFPAPNYALRRELWQHYLGHKLADENTLNVLAGQFTLTSAQIRDAVASANDQAQQQQRSLDSNDLFLAARAHSNPRLIELARKIKPRYTWDDIVLPSDPLAILHEIVATVRDRPLVLEQWGVGQKLVSSAGVTVLFAGPPGTGKTMAAEVIAAELGLDLYKIDLSTIVSKYIGETEKNLEKIFSEAQSSNAILFFDEADAIFGKRSEVKDSHDRYANIEVSYLLQRMEAYDGVTILATNLRANLDEAFTRRLQFAVDFPFPDETDRLRIWQTLFPPAAPRDPDIDFSPLAKRFRLTGGSIRNIIINAAYLAASEGGKISMKHLLHGTRRELQKMGRLVEEAEFKMK